MGNYYDIKIVVDNWSVFADFRHRYIIGIQTKYTIDGKPYGLRSKNA